MHFIKAGLVKGSFINYNNSRVGMFKEDERIYPDLMCAIIS